MATSDVQELLSRVRNRLWYTQFAGAVRHAMWASAALIMLAVAVHLSARHVPVAAVLLALSVLWVALLLRAGWQRPDASACALWADRHLGGTSAFTTLLELNSGKQRHASAPALRWLESWAMAKVPDSLGHLAQRRESMRLSRPLLVMLVCAALATIVLALPHTVPESRQQAVALPPSGIGDAPTPGVQPPASAELVSEIASALRLAESRDKPERREAGRAPATGRGKTDEGKEPSKAQVASTPTGERKNVTNALSGTAVETAGTAGGTQTAGTGAGRNAGDSRDDRSATGVSRPVQGTIPVTRSAMRARRTPAEMQADMTEPATYDDESPLSGAATLHSGLEVAAATPPPATEPMRLTPTEATYIQAWMKATANRR